MHPVAKYALPEVKEVAPKTMYEVYVKSRGMHENRKEGWCFATNMPTSF